MKTRILLCISLIFILASCKKDELTPGYDESYKAWTAFKKSSANSYTYTAFGGSVFGYYAETKITVTDGKVAGREFLAGRYEANSSNLIVSKTWVETSANLNTHGNEAHEPLTLDQVYAKAKTEWLNASKKDNDRFLETNNNAMISTAGYVPKGCMDDCFNGIHIKDIKPLK